MPEATKNIVVYFAHLAIEQSVINRMLCDTVRNLPGVDFRDLHELYPDFFIDPVVEQAVLRSADLVVFQHPIYWYGSPAIFKHFVDTVWLRGFAYGPGGTALAGKDFLLVASTGALAEEYQPGGVHGHAFRRLVLHIEQTARFCGMRFLEPLVLHGGHGLPRDVIAEHAERYRRFLESYEPGVARRG